jgi:hypothetical protein
VNGTVLFIALCLRPACTAIGGSSQGAAACRPCPSGKGMKACFALCSVSCFAHSLLAQNTL